MAVTVTSTQRIRDYDTWRKVFDGHAQTRREYGFTNEAVYRGTDDANSILVVMENPSRDAVLAFAADPSVRDVMASSGSIGAPHVVLGESLATQPL